MLAAVNKINRKIYVAKRHGAANVALALTQKAVQLPALLAFKGRRWQLRGYHTTNYKKTVVEFAKEVLGELDVVAEVGCGPGEIVSRVAAKRKLGLDIDPQVISWARFLTRFSRGNVEFRVGSFDTLAQTDLEVIDLLITTGWFHVKSDEWIEAEIRRLLKANKVRYIMVDEFSHQRGRIQRLFDTIGTRVEQRHDWQDDKILFLYRCDG
jgi:ubiquinone/menaquinone biosynthesis C-methylase UbiE